jgi:hypothetical protein
VEELLTLDSSSAPQLCIMKNPHEGHILRQQKYCDWAKTLVTYNLRIVRAFSADVFADGEGLPAVVCEPGKME